MSIWIWTREVNDYNQYGEYFVDAWTEEPTPQILMDCGVPENRLRHIFMNGGGRVGVEDEWFYLHKKV